MGWRAYFKHGRWQVTIYACSQHDGSRIGYDETVVSDLYCNTVTITRAAAAQMEIMFAADPTLHHAWWDGVRRLASDDMYHLRQEQVAQGVNHFIPLPITESYGIRWSAYHKRGGVWCVLINGVTNDAAP